MNLETVWKIDSLFKRCFHRHCHCCLGSWLESFRFEDVDDHKCEILLKVISHIIVEKYSTWKALLKNFSLVVIFMLNITPTKVSMHLRQQVATTCHGNTSQQQITSCVLDNFCENLCLWNRVLSPQQAAQIRYHLIFYDWLQQQNSVPETRIFTKI